MKKNTIGLGRLGQLGRMTAIAVTAAAGLLQGCAHQSANERLDTKLTTAREVPGAARLRDDASQAIRDSKGLTDAQKGELLSLQQETSAHSRELYQKSLKLKSVLIEDELSDAFDESEVDLIKKRLRAIEEERLSLLFNAVDRADAILGRTRTQENQRILWMMYGAPHDSAPLN